METVNNVVKLTTSQSFTLNERVEVYMIGYKGRDPQMGTRLDFFSSIMGDMPIADIDADHVDAALVALRKRGKLHYMADLAEPKQTHQPLANATLQVRTDYLLPTSRG